MRFAITVTLAALAAVTIHAGKPFPEWSDKEVFKLLTNSPWAKPRNVALNWIERTPPPITYKDIPGNEPKGPKSGSPVGGIGVPRSKMPQDADIIVRWASALPVRQAVALYRQRDEKLDASKVNELIGVPSPEYVVEVFGVPPEVAHSGAESIEALLMQSAALKTRSGRTIRASRVRATLQGLSLQILIHFPRATPLTLKDQEVEVTGDLQIVKFSERFKLESMVYLGHLEL